MYCSLLDIVRAAQTYICTTVHVFFSLYLLKSLNAFYPYIPYMCGTHIHCLTRWFWLFSYYHFFQFFIYLESLLKNLLASKRCSMTFVHLTYCILWLISYPPICSSYNIKHSFLFFSFWLNNALVIIIIIGQEKLWSNFMRSIWKLFTQYAMIGDCNVFEHLCSIFSCLQLLWVYLCVCEHFVFRFCCNRLKLNEKNKQFFFFLFFMFCFMHLN